MTQTTEAAVLNTLHAIADNYGGYRDATATTDSTGQVDAYVAGADWYVRLTYTLAGNAATLLDQKGSDAWITGQASSAVLATLSDRGYWAA